MPIAISLLLVVFFLLMNAFFVIAEFAIVRVRPSQIEMAVREKKPGALAAQKVTGRVNDYLSACQLGITLASLALGWLGEPAFSALLRPPLSLVGIPDAAISVISVACGYLIMTTLHVVAGELIPKSFAILAAEKMALRTSPILAGFYRVTYPIMWLFNTLTNAVVRLAGHGAAREHEAYTDEEIKLLIDESTESGLIDPDQNEYVDNIFEIGGKDAESIMTPRTDIVCIDTKDSLEENMRIVRSYKFTRYPVCEGNKDRVVGFVHVKDLFLDGDPKSMDDLRIRPITAVPESISVSQLLQVLQGNHTKIAAVIDEHGGTAGIVTMGDIMEQIIGRVHDEYAHGTHGEARQLGPGRFLIDGSYPIDETVELIGFEPKEAAEVETAGGLLLALLDCIPEEGESIMVESPDGATAAFTVMDMDNLRIDKIEVRLSSAPSAEEE